MAIPARAQPPQVMPVAAELARLQIEDARLQTIGWRLATGNAPFCADSRLAIGLVLQDLRDYSAPGSLRGAIGIAGDIAIGAVAQGSPAAKVGLVPNQEVLAIDGKPVNGSADGPVGSQLRVKMLHDRIEASLAATGKVSLTLAGRQEPLQIAGIPACAGRFELRTDSAKARADGDRVMIGRLFGVSHDPVERLAEGEFAAVVAHEFAHNLLGHGALLERAGRTPSQIRKTEREADRLSLWLLVNAGFDPETAPRLMRGWGRLRDPGLPREPTHHSWEDRAALMEAELPRVRAALQQHGVADWPRDFVRE